MASDAKTTEISTVSLKSMRAPEMFPRGSSGDPQLDDLRGRLQDNCDIIANYFNNVVNVNVLSIADGSIGAGFSNGSAAIVAGSVVEIEVPFNCTIIRSTLVADVSGSIVIDVLKSTYAGYSTMTSIVAALPPTLSAAQKSQDTTLTGWTTAIAKGDIVRFSVTSAATITRAEISLAVIKGA